MKRILTIFLLLSAATAGAQKNRTGNWFQYFGSNKISKRWNWHNEVQYRNYNFGGDLEQLLLRTGIGYDLSENNNNLLLGYGYIHSEPYDASGKKSEVNEHRIFQQFITRQRTGRFYLQHRYRIEERFIGDQDARVRFRYFLSLNLPINKPEMTKGAFYLSAYNEIFVNARAPLFDRDRIYGALGYQFSQDIRLEIGMMNQIQETRSRAQAQIALFNNLPLFKAR
ncbi:DUF2490 domain-containing protein [Flaviaesturariibacter flavus]|uniref:DUF2490 domain-containing protein n=1 Tax=Flaviaesturariibacter flavus TaxID=2502780 RepID=A0A4R1BJX2_9BACT|nr:DUF2490 domain-containing protein [Flaviaesturariibacter flavus]TCJ17599.1 DUF2490 domain-containing protein [Flaviaesturariibacter flavus]